MLTTAIAIAALLQQPPRKVAERHFQLADLDVVRIKVNDATFKAWVMDTDPKKEEGMMFLKNTDFTEKQAMIFLFKAVEPERFWMKNTYVNLDIAYVGPKKDVVKTYTMAAFDTETDYSSGKPSPYVIEFKEGVLKKYKIKVGDKVEILDPCKAKD